MAQAQRGNSPSLELRNLTLQPFGPRPKVGLRPTIGLGPKSLKASVGGLRPPMGVCPLREQGLFPFLKCFAFCVGGLRPPRGCSPYGGRGPSPFLFLGARVLGGRAPQTPHSGVYVFWGAGPPSPPFGRLRFFYFYVGGLRPPPVYWGQAPRPPAKGKSVLGGRAPQTPPKVALRVLGGRAPQTPQM